MFTIFAKKNIRNNPLDKWNADLTEELHFFAEVRCYWLQSSNFSVNFSCDENSETLHILADLIKNVKMEVVDFYMYDSKLPELCTSWTSWLGSIAHQFSNEVSHFSVIFCEKTWTST